jgi:hypothetical protein
MERNDNPRCRVEPVSYGQDWYGFRFYQVPMVDPHLLGEPHRPNLKSGANFINKMAGTLNHIETVVGGLSPTLPYVVSSPLVSTRLGLKTTE